MKTQHQTKKLNQIKKQSCKINKNLLICFTGDFRLIIIKMKVKKVLKNKNKNQNG